MIILPIPTSKKEMRQADKDMKLFLKSFPKIFILTDIILVIAATTLLSLFDAQLKTNSLVDFFALMAYLQTQLFIPLTGIALVITLIKYR